MKLLVKKGTTSKRLKVFINDSTVSTGAGKTALTNSDVTAYYIREGDSSATSISVVSATLGTYTSGGFIKIHDTNMPGAYEFDPPDACFATGANSVLIMIKGTGIAPVLIECQLVDFDPNDAGSLGLTAVQAQLIDSVTHGGAAAKFQLGSTSSTPPFQVNNSAGPAVRWRATGGNNDAFELSGNGTGHDINLSGDGLIAGNINGKILGNGSKTISAIGVRPDDRIISGQALSGFMFEMIDASDNASPATGKTVSGTVCIDGSGGFVALTNSPTEIGFGIYKCNLAAADLTGTNIMLRFSASGCRDTFIELTLQPA